MQNRQIELFSLYKKIIHHKFCLNMDFIFLI